MKFRGQLLLAFLSISTLSNAQLRFPEQPLPNGPGEIAQALEKLNTVGSVLYLAAHPDDENTRMISWLANERKVRTAYLSLTRGDGGQNLIGSEKGEELGLLRTQELLEARKVDGGEQFFTRAKDFGYTKNPEESFEIWGKKQILADVVWVIRKFQPDVIICRFPTTGEGGHGHHTASAMLANEAFELAASSKAFPEQLQYVKTWQPKRVLWNSFSWNRKPNEVFPGEILVQTGGYNTLLGKNYGEMAATARSKHRCQGFGSRLARGEVQEYVKNIMGDSIQNDVLERVDLSWNRIEGGAPIGKAIQKAIASYDIRKPESIIPQLLTIRKQIIAIKDEHWMFIKLREVDQLILACSGVFLDAHSPSVELTPGAKFEVNIEAINRSNATVTLEQVDFNGNVDSTFNTKLLNNQWFSNKRNYTLPALQAISQPNWLAMPEENGIYAPKKDLWVDFPENPAALQANFHLKINDTEFVISKPIWHKEIDPSIGEVYQPLVVSPPAIFDIPTRAFMLVNGQPKTLNFAVKALADSTKATINLSAGRGLQLSWTSKDVFFKKAGELVNLEVVVTPAAGWNEAGKIDFSAEINGTKYGYMQRTVSYPHIYKQNWFPEASVMTNSLSIKGNVAQIGYIKGPGDEVAESLGDIGFTVKALSDQELQSGDLSKYKAIICGIRTYNTNDKMALYQPNLNKYVENGGTYIVQYQTNNFIGGTKSAIAPAKITLGRERVTREEAEIKIIDPMLTTTPNEIGAADFANWVQERGLYFASEWDPIFKPVLEMNDPGEKPQQGSTLVGKFGKGEFIYTGISFFRQLPAGNPGAFRLLTNMIQQ